MLNGTDSKVLPLQQHQRGYFQCLWYQYIYYSFFSFDFIHHLYGYGSQSTSKNIVLGPVKRSSVNCSKFAHVACSVLFLLFSKSFLLRSDYAEYRSVKMVTVSDWVVLVIRAWRITWQDHTLLPKSRCTQTVRCVCVMWPPCLCKNVWRKKKRSLYSVAELFLSCVAMFTDVSSLGWWEASQLWHTTQK